MSQFLAALRSPFLPVLRTVREAAYNLGPLVWYQFKTSDGKNFVTSDGNNFKVR